MYERILIPFDGSATSEKALQEAIALAKLTGARLRIVHVVEIMHVVSGFEPAVFLQDTLPRLRKAGETILEQANRRAADAGVATDTVLLESVADRVSDIVVDQAKTWNADLIVIGTHGRRGMRRLMLGSDAEEVVRMAPAPVLLVRTPEELRAAAAAS